MILRSATPRRILLTIGCLTALISLMLDLLADAGLAAEQGQLAVAVAENTASPTGGSLNIKTIDPSGTPTGNLVSLPGVNVVSSFRIGNQVGSVSWSPDGSKLAYYQITGAVPYQIDPNTSTFAPEPSASGVFLSPGGQVPGLTWDLPNKNMNFIPAWSPTGNEIAYWAYTPQGNVLRAIHPDGTGMRPVTMGGANPQGASQVTWAPDGKTIAFSSAPGFDQGGNLLQVPAAGGTATYLALPEYDGSLVGQPAYSPDGKSIAFIRQRFSTFPYFRRLVVRDLATGAERTVTDTYPRQSPTKVSWSPDGKRIAFIEDAPACGYGGPSGCDLLTINADGTDKKKVLHADYIGSVAWSPGSAPNYYIKHIEVAQAISPDLGPLNGFDDPLAEGERDIPWSLPSVAGSTIPLVAGKETLLRIYVGDSKLEPGTREEASIFYKVTGSTLSPSVDRLQKVTVTAPDVDPTQTDAGAALNFWLPRSVAQAGVPVSLHVEINTLSDGSQDDPECDGCYPNGNKASVKGIKFDDGGNVIIAPVPIYVIAPDQTVIGPREGWEGLWPLMTPMLPVGDSGVSSVPSPAAVAVNFNDLLPSGAASLPPVDKWYACSVLLTRVEEERLISAPATLTPGALRWVGLTSHPLPMSTCGGQAFRPGRSMLLTVPRPEIAVHELGHSVGLPHTLGYGEVPPHSPVALPYIGIGGAGYENFGGYLINVFNKLNYGDVMSYSPKTWTSPVSWHRMWDGILAESGGLATPSAHRFATPRAAAPTMRSRRLVSGFIVGGHGVILNSLAANAAEPTSRGNVIGSIVARDRHGRMIATAKVRGKAMSDYPSPFVIGLPASERIASLALVPAAGGEPLSRLKASKHLPKAQFIRLPRRASASTALKVRWRASDRDRNRLSVILLAKRGKHAWDTIATGPAAFHARVKPWTLGRGKKLRLRLLAADGFNTTTVKARPVRLRCAQSVKTGGVAVPSFTQSAPPRLPGRSKC